MNKPTNKEILLKMVDLLVAKGKQKVTLDFWGYPSEREAYFLSSENFSIICGTEDGLGFESYAEDLMSYKVSISCDGFQGGLAIITGIFYEVDDEKDGIYFCLNEYYPEDELFNLLRFAIKFGGTPFKEE